MLKLYFIWKLYFPLEAKGHMCYIWMNVLKLKLLIPLTQFYKSKMSLGDILINTKKLKEIPLHILCLHLLTRFRDFTQMMSKYIWENFA